MKGEVALVALPKLLPEPEKCVPGMPVVVYAAEQTAYVIYNPLFPDAEKAAMETAKKLANEDGYLAIVLNTKKHEVAESIMEICDEEELWELDNN